MDRDSCTLIFINLGTLSISILAKSEQMKLGGYDRPLHAAELVGDNNVITGQLFPTGKKNCWDDPRWQKLNNF